MENAFGTKAFPTNLNKNFMLIYYVVVDLVTVVVVVVVVTARDTYLSVIYVNIVLVVAVNSESICFTSHVISLTLQPCEYRMVVIII